MKKGVKFGGVLSQSWKIFQDKFWIFVLLSLFLVFIPGMIFDFWNSGRTSHIIEGVTPTLGELKMEFGEVAPWTFGLWILTTLFTVSMIYFLNSKKKKLNAIDALKGGWSFYGKALILSALFTIFLIPLYIALVIPGIIFQIYWIFVLYVLVTEKTSVMESFRRSYRLVRGRWWKTLGYIILMYIIIIVISSISISIFAYFGQNAAIVFNSLVMTLTNIFSIIFVNNLYLGFKKK